MLARRDSCQAALEGICAGPWGDVLPSETRGAACPHLQLGAVLLVLAWPLGHQDGADPSLAGPSLSSSSHLPPSAFCHVLLLQHWCQGLI